MSEITVDAREVLSSICIGIRMPRLFGFRMWIATKLFALAGLACGMRVAVSVNGEDVDDATDIIREVGHLHRLEAKPGDRFVISCPGRLSAADADCIQQIWESFMGNAPLLVLTEGKSLGVVSQEELRSAA